MHKDEIEIGPPLQLQITVLTSKNTFGQAECLRTNVVRALADIVAQPMDTGHPDQEGRGGI